MITFQTDGKRTFKITENARVLGSRIPNRFLSRYTVPLEGMGYVAANASTGSNISLEYNKA